MENKALHILVSNRGIPTNTIGSWTTRISKLNQQHSVFNYILSPSNQTDRNVFCKKRKFITWKKELRALNLKLWVARDYIKAIRKLSKKASHITIVIIDDLHLLEAITLISFKKEIEVKLIFSFHGFKLNLEDHINTKVDKILFLSHAGLEISKSINNDFKDASVVGNGVDSEVFYPLEKREFDDSRKTKGFSPNDEILIWVANDRPKKGIAVFHKVLDELLEKDEKLKVIIVGSLLEYKHPNVTNIGRVANHDVANYFQISNYYMFTTFYEEGFGLSMVEALKCGNAVIASNRGAIPEVLDDLNFTYLVNKIDNVNSWVQAFELVRKETNFGKIRINKFDADAIWNYNDWEQKFIKALNYE